MSYAGHALKTGTNGLSFVYFTAADAAKGGAEKEVLLTRKTEPSVYLRMVMQQGGTCRFSYSTAVKNFKDAGVDFTATAARWKGAKITLFCTRQLTTNDSGYADVDWFRIDPVQ